MEARVRFKTRLAAMALALWSLSALGAAADTGHPSDVRRIPFSEAPPPVQQYLIKSLAVCGASANVVRSTASFDVGPIGGPGHKDYFFVFDAYYWPRSTEFGREPPGTLCTGDFVWSMFSMDIGNGKYKSIEIEFPYLFYRHGKFLLFYSDRKSNCAGKVGAGMHTPGRFMIWNRAAAAFRPVTGCMTLYRAFGWVAARAYHAYDEETPG
jgi:hypothetical protein